MTTTQRLAYVVVLASVLLLALVVRGQVEAHYGTAVDTDCVVVMVTDDTTDAEVAQLLADGYAGRQDDGREALYSPRCA